MASIFTKIINGEIPCYKIAEDEDHFAFLDISPLTKGHTLVIPKVEVDYIFDLEDEAFLKLHVFSKRVSEAIKKSVNCVRVGTTVIGLEVPHAHIHLIPINKEGDMNFNKTKLSLDKSEFEINAEKIRTNF